MVESTQTHGRDDRPYPATVELGAPQVREQVTALKSWFRRHPDMRCLLVIDPTQNDPAADGSRLLASLSRIDLTIDHEAVSPAHYPYLLELDLESTAGADALAQSVELAFDDRRPQAMAEGMGQRIGGWLATTAAPQEVASHCSRMMLQRDDRDRLCLLRFYDPRAFALLWHVLSPVQQQSLLGPIQAWHTLDASAMPVSRLNTMGRRDEFELDAAQWQAIHRHGIVNRALALHAYDQDRQPHQHEVDVAVAAAARARQYGLIDEEDEVKFVSHALAWHPEFDLHPKVLQILGRKADDEFYAEQIEQLTPEEIEEICEGVWHERLRTSNNAGGRT
ncbi:DUF4123 domain-containing protein [Robbsia andropogonis]|nr:DUF4123 domain-containing protein [Robbsia andropogonis]